MTLVDVSLLTGSALYDSVVQQRLCLARESLWIATANVKAMMVEHHGAFVPVVDVLLELAGKGVEVRLLHADRPSGPFTKAMQRHARATQAALAMRTCPRVHFKVVLVDGGWLYMGSANLTGAGLGAKDPNRRNFELGLVTEDFATIDHVSALFGSIWSGAECATCKLHDRCPAPIQPQQRPARKGRSKSTGSGLTLGKARRLPRNGPERS